MDKELWQEFANKEFNGKLGDLIRAAVTNYVTNEIGKAEQIEITLELQEINEKLETVLQIAEVSYARFVKDVRKGNDVLVSDDSSVVPLDQFDEEALVNIPEEDQQEIMDELRADSIMESEAEEKDGSSRFDF